MKVLLPGAAALISLCAASSAVAQEWTGAYVGLQVGVVSQPGDANERITFDRNLDGKFNDSVTTVAGANAFSPGFCGGAATSPANSACRGDDEGIDGGVRAGYDWQTGAWVFGLVGEVSSVNASDSMSGFSTTPASYTFTREANWVAAARFKAGYAAGPYLLYGTGGFAHGDVDHRFSTSNTANAFTPRSDDSLNGTQWGLGVERKWNESWSLGLEYLYTSLDDDEYTVRVTQGTATATNPFVLAPNTTGTDLRRSHSEFNFDSIRLTASYRFQ